MKNSSVPKKRKKMTKKKENRFDNIPEAFDEKIKKALGFKPKKSSRSADAKSTPTLKKKKK